MPSAKGIWENIIATVVVLLVVAAVGWAASMLDTAVALWVVVLMVIAAVALGIFIGWLVHDRADLPRYQADLLGETMLALRDYAAGRLGIPFADLVERGVLAPARYGLSVVRGEEIRLAILELDDTGEAFRMTYESGHSLGRKENFSLPRTSLAGHAFDSKELQWTDNVDGDQRWQPHPKADKKRRYRSLASMPIVVGDESVAVLNVVSSEPSAFFKGDLTYIELLGALIALAWDIEFSADPLTRVSAESLESPKRGT